MMLMLRRKYVIGLMVLALVAAACGGGDDDAATDTEDAPLAQATTTVAMVEETTTAPPVEETTTAAPEEEFDLVGVVASYTSTIPEGWMAVGDLTAFKDAVAASNALVIDVREVGEYDEGHMEGAINLPVRTLAQNLDKIPTDTQVFIYCKSGWRAGLAVSSLRMLGYDNVLAYPPGWNGWTEAGEPVSTNAVAAAVVGAPEIAPELLKAVDGFLSTIPEGFLTSGDVAAVNDAMGAGAFMLDVRETGEYAEGHIPTAVNVPLRTITDHLDAIPADANVISYCKSGWRAALSVPVLHMLGYDTSKGFPGSWKAWTEAEQPIET